MTAPVAVIRIDRRFQGPTGRGQGGWTAARLAAAADGPVTVRLAAPIPLERDLHVLRAGPALRLIDPTACGALVMEATPWRPAFPTTPPVAPAAARRAGLGCRLDAGNHPAPHCFSCGLDPDSMRVHAGPLGDGRVATAWRAPDWAWDASGRVDPGAIWGALDCVAGFYVALEEPTKPIFTVQYAVEILAPLAPGRDYALVGWRGAGPARWEGRKRTAASAAFDEDGRLVARSRSFWVAGSA